MTNDFGQANANGTWSVYDYVSITSVPGNSGGPLWYQSASGPYVVGICSTGLWAADITLTFSQLQAWISGDATACTARAAGPPTSTAPAATTALFGRTRATTRSWPAKATTPWWAARI